MGLLKHHTDARRRLQAPEYAFLLGPSDKDARVALHTQFQRLYGHDPLICIGAVKIRANRAEISKGLELLFHPQDQAPPRDLDIPLVSQAQALDRLLRFVSNCALVGYQIAHHLRVLNRFIEPMIGIPLPNRAQELVTLYRARDDWRGFLRPAPSLDELSDRLRVPLPGRHDAFNDALLTALLSIRLSRRLRPQTAPSASPPLHPQP